MPTFNTLIFTTGYCETTTNPPCENNGVCVSVSDTEYRCNCQTGFDGDTCEEGKQCLNQCLTFAFGLFHE